MTHRIADARTWSELARRIFAAMNDPSEYGCETPEALLWEVAKERGVNVSSLRKSLDAFSFLDREAPDWVHADRTPPSLSKALVVRAVYNLDNAKGRELLDDPETFLRTEKELREYLDQLRTRTGSHVSEGTTRASARRAARDFEMRVRDYFTECAETLGLASIVEVNSYRTDDPQPDLMFYREDGVQVAVEVKAARQSTQRRDVYDLLGHCSLWQMQGYETWVVGEKNWEDMFTKALEIGDRMGLKGTRYAILAADDNKESKLRWLS